MCDDKDDAEEPLTQETLGNELLLCARYGEDEDLATILDFKQNPEGESNVEVLSVDVNYVDISSGNTALHFAAANGHINCLSLLHKYGARFLLNKEGCSPVHWAAQNKQATALKFIFETYSTEVDVLQKNNSGRSALTDAFQSQDTETIEICLSHSSASEERLIDTNNSSSTCNIDTAINKVDESGDSEYDPLKHSVLHNFNISLNIVPDASLQILNMRELPITRADNPFGSETAPEDDSTGLCIWPASIILARWVTELYAMQSASLHPLRNKVVVELGAGCGLPLLSAAVYCRPHMALLTDIHKPTLDNAAYNVQLNDPSPRGATSMLSGDSQDFVYEFPPLVPQPSPPPSLPSQSHHPPSPAAAASENTGSDTGVTVRVGCLKLDWTAAPHFSGSLVKSGQADVLLGSDLVYDRKILNILVPTIKAILKEDGCFLYVAPDSGRDGMVDLTEALRAAGIVCVEATPTPERYFTNPLHGVDEDQFVLHFYDLSAKQPHTLYKFLHEAFANSLMHFLNRNICKIQTCIQTSKKEIMSSQIDEDFEQLPVIQHRDEILRACQTHQVVICIGETGSGKTTKIPQFLLNSGMLDTIAGEDSDRNVKTTRLAIGITQPRRIAAITVAQRVADDRGVRLGSEVGYTVRFDDCTDLETRIKYMTDGILIRECLSDKYLSKYGVIMLDEAHERSLNTDILFGLLKETCRVRPSLRVLITSATLDSDKFSLYFDNCPVIRIPGRIFPVDIYHSKTKQVMTANGPSNNSYIQSAVEVVMKIHCSKENQDGHILVFLTGQDEIEKACSLIRQAVIAEREDEDGGNQRGGDSQERTPRSSSASSGSILLVLPLYAALSTDAQRKVFMRPEALLTPQQRSQVAAGAKVRKCVVATNIAETSITVPQVRFVVDTGFVKQKAYDPSKGMESLVTVPISKIAALQRAGRAGRTGPGQCYRLYSSECFDNMMDETIPEIQRVNLANTVLYLKALGIRDVLGFDFLDPPSEEQVMQALSQLHSLGALDDYGNITPLGRKMSSFPLEPNLSRAVIESASDECDCLPELLIIAAMLSGENIWYRPQVRAEDRAIANKNMREQQQKDKRKQFQQQQQQRGPHSHGRPEQQHQEWERCAFSNSWCEQNFINHRSMKTVKQIRDHLTADVDKKALREVKLVSYTHTDSTGKKAGRLGLEQRISNAITAGYFMNAAVRCANESIYKSLPLGNKEGDVRMVYVHPNSVFVYTKPPEYVVYQDLVHSSKLFMSQIVKADWRCLQFHQIKWKFVHPQQLSGRKLVAEIEATDEKEVAKEDKLESKPESGKLKRSREALDEETSKAPSSSKDDAEANASAVEQARLRFLARKLQKGR